MAGETILVGNIRVYKWVADARAHYPKVPTGNFSIEGLRPRDDSKDCTQLQEGEYCGHWQGTRLTVFYCTGGSCTDAYYAT